MRRNKLFYFLGLTILAFELVVSGCSSRSGKKSADKNDGKIIPSQNHLGQPESAPHSNVINKEFLDSYKLNKTDYNFYFTYKIVHSWWDAVALGMEDAVEANTKKMANQIIKRFIENLEKILIPELGDTPITVSIGATIIKAGEPVEFAEQYKLIDTGVYESKKVEGSHVTFK